MERITKAHLLSLFLALLYVCAASEKNHVDESLTCYNDYNRSITCVLNGTHVSNYADNECEIHAKRLIKEPFDVYYDGSCILEPVDASRPTMRNCTILLSRNKIFQTHHELTIRMTCKRVNSSLNFTYQPFCNIKLNPPPKPLINLTSVSWLTQKTPNSRIQNYISQMQWKEEGRPWSNLQQKSPHCGKNCRAEMRDLILDGRYEARVRVKPGKEPDDPCKEQLSTWSDWSPITSWVSPIGRPRPTPTPTPTPPPQLDVLGSSLGFAAVMVAVPFLILLFNRNKTTWIVEKIRGPPLPNPAKSFLQNANFENWSPHFTSESLHPFLKRVEIVPLEMTDSVDAVAPSMRVAEKNRLDESYGSNSSSFSNPSYSRVSPSPPPVSSLKAGNLQPCAEDSPYGPVCSQDEGKYPEEDGNDVRGNEKIQQLFSKNNSEPMTVISDYGKVENPQVNRGRLQSLDSGMCSGEEVSQESLEADSTECTDGCSEKEEEKEGGNGMNVDFQKFFKGTFEKGSIQVCSDYNQIQRQQSDTSELPSLDSGLSSGGEEQVSQEESMEDVDISTETTSFMFPPSCSLPFFMPLNVHGAGLPLPGHVLESIALVPANSVEPSCDGYMPVRQEQY